MLKPTDDTIVMKMLPKREKLRGIHLPGGSNVVQNEAIVLAVGPGRWVAGFGRVPLDVKVGDRVILTGGYPVQMVLDTDDEEYGISNAGVVGTVKSFDGNLADKLKEILGDTPTEAVNVELATADQLPANGRVPTRIQVVSAPRPDDS